MLHLKNSIGEWRIEHIFYKKIVGTNTLDFFIVFFVWKYIVFLYFTFFIVFIMDIKKIYFSREWRLSRAKFFWYLLLVGIAISLVNYLLGKILPDVVYVIVSTLLWLAILFFFYPALIYKRQHDRNKDGKIKVMWIWIVFGVSYLLSFVSSTINITSLIPIQTEAQQLVQQLKSATTTWEQAKISQDMLSLQQQAVSQVFTPINISLYIAMIIFSIWSLVLLRPLIFFVGTSWKNQYDHDPLEKKKK